ncbi:MAG: hypothetical protein OXU36_02490, partial [Candidatus Poribacteria bacterium]|nr:hypothetical protein [Candidatus Poribacteria bacterium]
MKIEFKTLYKLIVICMMCGLVSFIYTGCSPPMERSSTGFVFTLPALNPPNSAAYDDVFFKNRTYAKLENELIYPHRSI